MQFCRRDVVGIAPSQSVGDREINRRERTIHHPGGTDEPVTTAHALVRLREELRELQLAVETGQEPEVVAREAADVANFALIVADLYAIDPKWLKNLKASPAMRAEAGGVELRFAERKELHGTTTVAFAQTLRGVPIWEAGKPGR